MVGAAGMSFLARPAHNGWVGYVNMPDESVSDVAVYPNTASAMLNLLSNGEYTKNGSTGNWFFPTLEGIGSIYWVRATVVSGSVSIGTTDTWLQLSTNPIWTRTQTTVGTSSVTLTLEFAADAGGTNIVDTATAVLTAEVDPYLP